MSVYYGENEKIEDYENEYDEDEVSEGGVVGNWIKMNFGFLFNRKKEIKIKGVDDL